MILHYFFKSTAYPTRHLKIIPLWDRRGRDRMVVGFTTIPMQSVPITTDVMSSNLDQGKVYNIM